MGLEDIVLSKVSHTNKEKYLRSHLHVELKKKGGMGKFIETEWFGGW